MQKECVVHFKPLRAPIPPSKGSPSHAGGRSDQYSFDIPAARLMVKGDRAKVPRAIQFGQLNQQGLSLSTLEDRHLRPKPALFLQHGICNPLLQPIALTLKALLFGLRNANIRILAKLHHPFHHTSQTTRAPCTPGHGRHTKNICAPSSGLLD